MRWVARIQHALEENRFRVYGQTIAPIAAGGEAQCYELLLRLEDEAGNMILPENFLPTAERYNLATKIDRWVVSNAFTWLVKNPGHRCTCFINLSGHSLGNKAFLTFIIDKFNQMNIPPAQVCFEITETAAIANISSATRFIKSLKAYGCKFSLDDFGSGLSSFAYLKNLPIDYLKVAGFFVRDILDDPIDLAMVRSINHIGRVMGKNNS